MIRWCSNSAAKPLPRQVLPQVWNGWCCCCSNWSKAPAQEPVADVYFVAVGDAARVYAITLAEAVRDHLDGYNVQVNCEGGSFKSQLKKADKSGARLAVIVGEREVAERSAGIKPLRGAAAEQFSVAQSELAARLQGLLP